jgi:hypothetical protein
MGRSNNSFIKKQKADRKSKKRKEKFENRLERKGQESSGKLEDMIAYVDEFGNISDTPPEDPKTVKDDKTKSPKREAHVKGDEKPARTSPRPVSRESSSVRDSRETRDSRESRDTERPNRDSNSRPSRDRDS